jgi:hypothetical protein
VSSAENSSATEFRRPKKRSGWKVWRDPRRNWLEAELDNLRTDPKVEKGSRAESDLRSAGKALHTGDLDAAWHLYYFARRELVSKFDAHELEIAMMTLRAEIRDPCRLAQWRIDAIRKQLNNVRLHGDEKASDEAVIQRSRRSVAEAVGIRNEGVSNDFWRLAIVRHYQKILMILGAPFLIAVVTLLAVFSSQIGNHKGPAGWVVCVLSALVGVLGAITSAAQRSARVHQDHVIAQMGSNVASLSRLPIGAVAGLTVWLFSIATTETSAVNAPNLLLAAFGAGFAERLIVQGQPPDTNDSDPRLRVPHEDLGQHPEVPHDEPDD